MAFLVTGLVLWPGWVPKAIAFAGFLLAGLTDWLDGYLARRRHQTTALGALLDPIADKVLVLGGLMAFVRLQPDLVPAWIVLLIFIREVVVTALRLLSARHGIVLAAAAEGKQKTVVQLLTIAGLFVLVIADELALSDWRESGLRTGLVWTVCAGLWITVGLTVSSGVSFLWRHRTALGQALNH